MTNSLPRLRYRLKRADAHVALGMLAGTVFEPYRPLMANLVVTRRCNLSCGYCHEFDHTSPPVSLELIEERLDHLARLRTVVVTLTGGETLIHPEITAIVRAVRARGMTPALNTNGFLLSRELIHALNDAGLYAMQVSVDAATPNEVTKKALRPLLPKLKVLAEEARFRVRVNTVLGAAPPEEALEVARTVLALGFDAKASFVRHADGTMVEADAKTRLIYEEIERLEGRRTGVFRERFQDELLRDGKVRWKCRAGARFFHVCEDGLVHLCAPRLGSPAKPLATYSREDLKRAFHERKSCADHCPVAYAHQLSEVDRLRPQERRESANRRRLPVIA